MEFYYTEFEPPTFLIQRLYTTNPPPPHPPPVQRPPDLIARNNTPYGTQHTTVQHNIPQYNSLREATVRQ
jgi:hypothetical protein